ncbi:MAG: hypothetical protein INH05_11290 [Burkholderiales bacterium]|nr:hypothetical protein [Burkholderiales bacterium]
MDIEYLAVESGVSDVEAFSKHVHAVWDAHADQLEAYLAREVPGVPVEVFASIVQKADPNRFAKLVEKHLRTQSPKVWAGEVAKFKTLTAKPAAVSQVREQTAEEAPRPRQLSEGETQAFLREAMERFKRDNIRPARRR